MNPASIPTLAVFALFACALCVLLIGIDALSGVARVRSRVAANPEDVSLIGATLAGEDTEPVARALRAHRNAVANVVPFLVATFLWILLGASRGAITWVCVVFTAARFLHAVAYLRGVQPWRSLGFLVGQVCLGVVLVQLARAALALV